MGIRLWYPRYLFGPVTLVSRADCVGPLIEVHVSFTEELCTWSSKGVKQKQVEQVQSRRRPLRSFFFLGLLFVQFPQTIEPPKE